MKIGAFQAKYLLTLVLLTTIKRSTCFLFFGEAKIIQEPTEKFTFPNRYVKYFVFFVIRNNNLIQVYEVHV